jgi:catechol 2,3-dioxygenase-like lactoylglutathione lyase family enzyme
MHSDISAARRIPNVKERCVNTLRMPSAGGWLKRCTHISLIVPNLDKAEAQLRSAFGITVKRTLGGPKAIMVRGVRFEFADFRGALAEFGSIGVELLEEQPGSIFRPSPDGGFHHLAFEVIDLDEASRQLLAEGWVLEAVPCVESHLIRWMYMRSPLGMRFELESPTPPGA